MEQLKHTKAMLHHYKFDKEEHRGKARRKHQKEDRWSLGGGALLKGESLIEPQSGGDIYGHFYTEVKEKLTIKKLRCNILH